MVAALLLVVSAGFAVAYALRPYSDIQRMGLGAVAVLSFAGAALSGLVALLARR